MNRGGGRGECREGVSTTHEDETSQGLSGQHHSGMGVWHEGVAPVSHVSFGWQEHASSLRGQHKG